MEALLTVSVNTWRTSRQPHDRATTSISRQHPHGPYKGAADCEKTQVASTAHRDGDRGFGSRASKRFI